MSVVIIAAACALAGCADGDRLTSSSGEPGAPEVSGSVAGHSAADPGMTIVGDPMEPEIPTDFALSVGPRLHVCDHPYADGPAWSTVPCHIVTATWQGIDDDRAMYNLVPWPFDPLNDQATLPIGPSPFPRVGTSYSATFAARPAQHLCVALTMSNELYESRGPVEACALVPPGEGEVVPTTVERPPMTTFADIPRTTIELPTEPLPSPLPAPTDFTLTVGELQQTCTHLLAHGWTTPCYVVTATWQHLDDNRMLHNLTPTPFVPNFDPGSATLPIGPDRYPRTATQYSVTFAARPAQHLCVELRAYVANGVEGSEGVEACVDIP